MTDVEVEAPGHCRSCGEELKASALFCTGCGARREDETDAPDGAACAACGAKLKTGVDFCTQCGVATAAAPAGSSSDGSPTPKERISPAASRAILGSVTGGMGSYVGKTASAGGAAPPPKLTRIEAEENRRRRILIAVIIAVTLGLLGGIGAIIATQGSDSSSLHAGGSGAKGVDRPGGGHGGGSSDGGSTGSHSNGSSAGSGASATSGGSSSTTGSSGGSGSSSTTSGGSGGGSSPGTSGAAAGGSSGGGGIHGGGTSHGGTAAAPVPPARLVLSSTNLSVSDVQGDSVTITNRGGRSGSWTISGSSTGGLGGNLSFSRSYGYLAPGASATVGVTWTGGNEGTGSGSFNVNGGGGPFNVGVNLDSTYSDTVYTVNMCGTRCTNSNADILIQMVIGTQQGFSYQMPDTFCFRVTNGQNGSTQCWGMYAWAYYGQAWVPGVGWVARIQVPVRNNTPVPGTTQISVWDLTGGPGGTPLSNQVAATIQR